MKRLFSLLLFGLLIGLAAAEPKVPQLTGRVVDQAKIFGASGAEKIDAAIRALETATGGGQMAVLTVDTLDGTPIEEFGIRVMDQWKIGRKGKDDGAILIIALRDRAMRLEIGYGWEGEINDARAGDIIRGLAPFFRENRYTDGVLFAVGEVQRFVTGKAPENQPKAPARAVRRKQEQSDSFLPVIIFIIAIALEDNCPSGKSMEEFRQLCTNSFGRNCPPKRFMSREDTFSLGKNCSTNRPRTLFPEFGTP